MSVEVGVIGLMGLIGISLDVISMIVLIMGIGFSGTVLNFALMILIKLSVGSFRKLIFLALYSRQKDDFF